MSQIKAAVAGSMVLDCLSLTPSDGTVVNSSVGSAAGIVATKLQQQYSRFYSQASATTASAITIPLHLVYGTTATLVAIQCGTIVACTGNATITIDLKKNGVSVLTSTVVLDNANVARIVEAGAITTTGAVQGDSYELVVTVNAGTGVLGTGLFVGVIINEDPR